MGLEGTRTCMSHLRCDFCELCVVLRRLINQCPLESYCAIQAMPFPKGLPNPTCLRVTTDSKFHCLEGTLLRRKLRCLGIAFKDVPRQSAPFSLSNSQKPTANSCKSSAWFCTKLRRARSPSRLWIQSYRKRVSASQHHKGVASYTCIFEEQFKFVQQMTVKC